MDAVYTEKLNGLTIKIIQDDNAESPSEWGDENLFLVGYHRQFSVDSKIVSKDDCLALIEGKSECKSNGNYYPLEIAKKYHVFGLEAYIHSGVRLALANEGNFVDRQWDVSLLGCVFVSKSEWKTKAKARKGALGLIETYNDYLSGNVYGYKIETAEGEELEAVWGFYGDYDAKGGVLDEARSSVKHLTNNGKTDHKGQKLMEFVK